MTPTPPTDAPRAWPALPLEPWRDTFATLQLWTQIVGKTRLALAPPENHWWHVPLYVTPRGLTTSAMPYGNRLFSVDFDFLDHRLYLRTSDGTTRSCPSRPAQWPTSTPTIWRRCGRWASRSGCGRCPSKSRSRFPSPRTGSMPRTTPMRPTAGGGCSPRPIGC